MTKNNIISREKIFCENFFSKAIGLMFSRKSNKSLIFTFKKEKIIALHMIFVFYPIDVLFLDAKKKIVEIKENFRPFTFYKSKNQAKYVLELPDGTIKNTKIEIGDNIDFI